MRNVLISVVVLVCLNTVACADAEVTQVPESLGAPSFNVEGADVYVDAGLTVDGNEIAGVIDATNTWIGWDSTNWTAIDYSRVRVFVHPDGSPKLQTSDGCNNCAGFTETVKHAGEPETYDIHVKQYYNCMGHSVLDHELLHALSHMNGQDGDGNHTSVHMWHELLATIHIHGEIVCADGSLAAGSGTHAGESK